MVADQNDKIVKDLKGAEERNRQLENSLKSKQMELVEAMKKINETESKVYSTEDKVKELKDQLHFSSNELQKTKKILEIVQKDYDKTKADMLSYCQKLNESQKDSEDKTRDIKRHNETILSLESKYAGIKK